MSAYDQASVLINRCKRILALVDTYVDCPTQDHRTSLRKALIAEFDAAASAPPVAADVETIQQARANFEDWYTGHAADIKAAPIGSRDSMLQWSSWIAARSGNYVARGGWKISPGPWGPAGAPVAVGSADTCAEMRALCSAYGGTGDVHSLDGEWRGQCTCVHAWQQRAEKADARAKELEAGRQALQAKGQHPAPCARVCEAPAFQGLVRERDARIAQLEAQLARRAPLPPETQQAIAAARAAGQSIAATPGGLVFMNDGAEPDSSELDCPACGGSGHVADVPAGSAP